MKPRLDVAEMVAELTRPHTHRERYTVKVGAMSLSQAHSTRVPSLIDQLRHAAPSGAGGERTNSGFGSRPAARVEALDCLALIDLAASRWVRDLGEDDPTDTAAVVARLHGLLPSTHCCGKKPKAGCCTRHEIEHDVRRWWTQARIVTGWDSPAWRPDNTCPLCAVRGGLRVRLADQVALCAECGETWGPETISLLADHIRGENADESAAS